MVQWLRVHLPMQGTEVQPLFQEDATCCGATKSIRHNYRVCMPRPVGWQLLKPAYPRAMPCSKRSHCSEKPAHHLVAAARDCLHLATKTQSNQNLKNKKMTLTRKRGYQ